MVESLRVWKHDQGQLCWRELGQGSPLLLLHGWSMSHAVFSELAEQLASDYRLLIPDLPGHGRSTSIHHSRLDAYAQLLTAWLDTLGYTQLDVLGWSLGGQIALQLASQAHQQIDRLLLVSSTPHFCASDTWTAGLPEIQIRALRRGLQRRYLATMGEFFDLQFNGENLPAERRREIINFAVRPVGLADPENALATLDILSLADLRPLLAEISSKTLIIHGVIDQIIPLAAGQYLAESIPQATLVSLPGIGHAPFLSDPARVTRLVREFCQ